jgi:hypothetical protein
MSSRSARVSDNRERRRAAGATPPHGNNILRMVGCGLPQARPISCCDCPHFHRRQMSIFSAGESLHRFRWIINTTFEQIISQMVLHRPIECTRLTGHVRTGTHFSGKGVNQDLHSDSFFTGQHLGHSHSHCGLLVFQIEERPQKSRTQLCEAPYRR